MEVGSKSSPFLYMDECIQCQHAKDGGVEAFIAHLAVEHSIPTEWPSDRAARLTGAEAKKPYTTVAATRKKRRKLTTPRPLNSFMVGFSFLHIYWPILLLALNLFFNLTEEVSYFVVILCLHKSFCIYAFFASVCIVQYRLTVQFLDFMGINSSVLARFICSINVFAQHIRRNVLAIFDTASSSHVSRLLGEAWNLIPREVRALYDEEAARLSKIHNIEFPTYKYQPKPRQWQSSSVAVSASPATSTRMLLLANFFTCAPPIPIKLWDSRMWYKEQSLRCMYFGLLTMRHHNAILRYNGLTKPYFEQLATALKPHSKLCPTHLPFEKRDLCLGLSDFNNEILFLLIFFIGKITVTDLDKIFAHSRGCMERYLLVQFAHFSSVKIDTKKRPHTLNGNRINN
ncbi:Transcription factor Sox-6 [Echinococcus granulosus]|uniref:Transcription factor Sox-6 n=1 Tax=Echinococcus granulosus TaxID=6210 RepID=W6URP7_ECHGR|nr:Transcription factor Sox-6 [Echinococcus granulosus]EUB63361.1 Transcription factor Sox-6 [Echinococcus granulosus]